MPDLKINGRKGYLTMGINSSSPSKDAVRQGFVTGNDCIPVER